MTNKEYQNKSKVDEGIIKIVLELGSVLWIIFNVPSYTFDTLLQRMNEWRNIVIIAD